MERRRDPAGSLDRRDDDDLAPICLACGVTMVPAELSAFATGDRAWTCLECEETGEPDVA